MEMGLFKPSIKTDWALLTIALFSLAVNALSYFRNDSKLSLVCGIAMLFSAIVLTFSLVDHYKQKKQGTI